jgi:plasmid maintenance system antidote protein VapI
MTFTQQGPGELKTLKYDALSSSLTLTTNEIDVQITGLRPFFTDTALTIERTFGRKKGVRVSVTFECDEVHEAIKLIEKP